MATVTSLTAARILELASGWTGVADDQATTDSLVQQLTTYVQQNQAIIQELNDIILPQLNQELAANDTSLADLNDNVLPGLEASLASNEAVVNDLNTVTIPSLAQTLDNNVTNLNDLNDNVLPTLQQTLSENEALIADLNDNVIPSIQQAVAEVEVKPATYFETTAPVGTAQKPLNVDDVWYDTDDGYKSYRWDGNAWVPFSVEVADLSLTVRKFKTSSHMIY